MIKTRDCTSAHVLKICSKVSLDVILTQCAKCSQGERKIFRFTEGNNFAARTNLKYVMKNNEHA